MNIDGWMDGWISIIINLCTIFTATYIDITFHGIDLGCDLMIKEKKKRLEALAGEDHCFIS